MNSLVVKTTKLESRTCMDTGFDRLHLSIYKGKVFIGSFGCRNDCMAVHFNCQKRRNAGVPYYIKNEINTYIIFFIIEFDKLCNIK